MVNAVLIILTALVLHDGFLRRMPKLGRWGAALLALLFVFAPASGAMIFFRSAKVVTSLGIAVAGVAAWSLVCRRGEAVKSQRGTWLVLGISLLLLPYCDRQGLFAVAVFAMACAAFLLLFSLRKAAGFFAVSAAGRRRLGAGALLGVGSVLLATFYNLEIAPRLILHYNGYRPSFEYQNVGGAGGVFNFSGGLFYLFDNIGFTVFGIAGSFALVAGVQSSQ